MVTPEQLQQLSDLLPTAHTVIVLVSNRPSVDELAAAVSLVSALQASDKEVLFAGPKSLVGTPDYLDTKMYATSLGNRNLVVSFEYDEAAVENVSYHIGEDSGKFFLTIKPQKGHKPLDASKVEFAYSGIEADLVFLVGVGSYDALEELYVANEQLFADTPTISLHTYETTIGQLKLDASGEPSISTVMAQIIHHLNLPLSAESATTLLAGIEQSTQNFKSFSTTAETLELAAWLMRLGARRVWRGETLNNSSSGLSDTQSFAEVFSKKSDESEKAAKKPRKTADKKLGGLDYAPDLTVSSK